MKKPRLSDEERLVFESMLRAGKTVHETAKTLARPVTTIIREVKVRVVESDKGLPRHEQVRVQDGVRKAPCLRPLSLRRKKAVQVLPPVQLALPRVCRADVREAGQVPVCLQRLHGRAQVRPTQEVRPPREGTENYETILSESRTGANVTEGELLAFDALLRDFTAKGQSVHAAMASNPNKFIVSEKTVYRYINSGLLSTKRGDLPRACMLRPRKGKGVEHRIDKTCRVGRTREDCELPEIVMRRKAR